MLGSTVGGTMDSGISGWWPSQAGTPVFSSCDFRPYGGLVSTEAHRGPANRRWTGAFYGSVHGLERVPEGAVGAHHLNRSAAEIVVASTARLGIKQAVELLTGGFALAIWDREREELWLGRDRLGIKPLYYGFTPDGLVFGSDLAAFRAHPDRQPEIDRAALHLYLRYNTVPAPYAIYRDTYKVRPGTLLRFRAPRRDAMEENVYWSAAHAAVTGQACPFRGTPANAVDQLDSLLREAITARLPTGGAAGAFLSGGVDSSTVAALMQAQSGQRIRTFSIGSLDTEFDEAEHARAVAQHLGTEHTELYVTPVEALAIVPRLAQIYDEPFADYSQIPTLLACELARRSVAVVLAGDGGDEVFAGYNRHVWGGRVWRLIRMVPTPARAAVARALTSVAPEAWDRGFERFGAVLPGWLRHRMPGYKMHKLAGSLRARSPFDLYRHLTSYWTAPGRIVIGGQEPAESGSALPELVDFTSQMVLMDQLGYLPDDGLVKVEQASRAVGLDVRVPLLDHSIVEFGWQLPLDLKLRGSQGKWVLRQVLYRYVPRELIERPKLGFGVPLGAWLRGPLREWAEELLDERRLRADGYFNPEPIRSLWAQHLAGTHRWEYQLWSVLMFQAWLDEYHAVPTGVR